MPRKASEAKRRKELLKYYDKGIQPLVIVNLINPSDEFVREEGIVVRYTKLLTRLRIQLWWQNMPLKVVTRALKNVKIKERAWEQYSRLPEPDTTES